MFQMTQPQYRYDGFISYRHHPRDMKIAAKLMSLLEKMSTSDKRRLRIFRDQSELPTSDNLGNDIHTALEQSRFLNFKPCNNLRLKLHAPFC